MIHLKVIKANANKPKYKVEGATKEEEWMTGEAWWAVV